MFFYFVVNLREFFLFLVFFVNVRFMFAGVFKHLSIPKA